MKKAKLFMMLALLVMGVSNVFAQNVTISAKTGNLIGSLSESGETGFAAGLSCLWRHEQLALSFTSSDEDDMTETGEIAKPKAVIGKRYIYNESNVKVDSALFLAGGHRATYLTVSLPKGYRITGYKIVLANDLINYNLNPNQDLSGSGGSFNNLNNNTGIMRFYETTAWTTGGTGINTYNTLDPQGCNILAQAKAMDGDTDINTGNTDRNKEYTIERTSTSDTDMGNQLYFRLTKNYFYYGLTIKSFEIWFTAEGTFEAYVVPEAVGQARSVVSSPFKTNKIDIGNLEKKTQEGTNATFYCYDYDNVTDLTAYNTLYQANAVANGVPTQGSEAKHIYPVRVDGQDLYAFGNDTYFIESPISVHTQTGLEAPVGYRIVGARFNYLWGTTTTGGTQTKTNYYVTYTSGGTTYYLNDQRHFTTNKFAWSYDSNTGGLYTGTGNNIQYLACNGSGRTRPLSSSSDPNNYYNLEVFTRNGVTYLGWPEFTYRQNGRNRNGQGYVIGTINAGSTVNMEGYEGAPNNAAIVTVETETETIPSFNPGTYTLNVYDKTGTTVEKTVNVTQDNAGGILELDDLNNDAVKFQIANLGEGKQALVSVTLLLQALNPYVDKMNIVCHDPNDQFTLTQTFTADDFSVAGGSFKFYVPTSKKDKLLTLTFSDLYSKYGDESYNGGDGTARYSFVTSPYFSAFDGVANNKVNPEPEGTTLDWNNDATDGGLYDSRYTTNQAGAAIPSTHKIYANVAGNIRFKFNNAEDLDNSGGGSGKNYLEETPFSVKDYLGSDDPDGTSTKGAFIKCQLMASSETQKSGTYFVFTADETRYNIAPTDSMQHRFYAFYRMDIELVAEDFTPTFTPTTVYENTFYESTSAPKRLKQYGIKLGTNETITIDDGNGGTKETMGYLSTHQVIEGLKSLSDIQPEQILYVDANELLSIVEMGDTAISQIKEGLGQNVLIYLPEKTTSTLDNFAYKTTSGSFRAGKDIVIKDKYPFFAPYDIQVDAADYAIYKREITNEQNGKVINATLMLPFTIDVNNGVHENKYVTSEVTSDFDPRCKFTMYQMNSENALAHDESSDNNKIDYGTGYFSKIEGNNSVANTPYFVVVDTYADGTGSYLVRCGGSLVKATPKEKNGIFEGESATGTLNEVTYDFTNTATYTGKEVGDENNGGAAAAEEKVFYFAHDYFLDSKALRAPKSTKILPFRAFYAYKESGAGAKMSRFSIAFGVNPNMGETNGITDVQRDADLAVIPGKNTITLMARADKDVTIHAVSGITVDKCSLNAGETRVVNVPAGVYIINGVKMVVK